MTPEAKVAYDRLCMETTKRGLHLELHVGSDLLKRGVGATAVEFRTMDRLTVREPRTKTTISSARISGSVALAAAQLLYEVLDQPEAA